MTPPAGYLAETRRRGRQATACLECNRRKQKCDRLQPCHHCAKRNLVDGCVYPDVKTVPMSPNSPSVATVSTVRHYKRKGESPTPGLSPKRERRNSEISNDRHHTYPAEGGSGSATGAPTNNYTQGHTGNARNSGSAQGYRSSPPTLSEHSHRSQGSLDSTTSSSGPGFSDPSESLRGFSPVVDRPPRPPLPSSLPPRPINRMIPISSERHELVTPPPHSSSPQHSPEQWRPYRPPVYDDHDRAITHVSPAYPPRPPCFPPHHPSMEMNVDQPHHYKGPSGNAKRTNGHAASTPAFTPAPRRRQSLPRIEDHLMQEGGAPGIGSLAKEGPEHHGDHFQFYGTSHFGPRLAAQVMRGGKPTLNISDSQYRSSLGNAELLHEIRLLDGALPRSSLCRLFVDAFFDKYNFWVDIIYPPDFYSRLDEFWIIHSEFEDLTQIDLRWFALFLTILAFGSLLNDQAGLDLLERQAISDKCFVAARKGLQEARSFYGESFDTVAALTLLSLYLVVMRRMPESWQVIGDAVRAAEAQGFQVDGERWHLPPKDAELWRRLWAQMYIVDRSVSYFLGRPLAIHDSGFTTRPPANMDDSELEILPRRDWPLTTTTRSTFLILHYKLAQIIGQILTSCFGLNPRNHADVMRCEDLMVQWSQSLPPAFRLDQPDTSHDDEQPWIRLQRRTLMSKFHQARISLHRPYLLPSGRADYAESRMCCVISAGVELRHRLSLLETDHDPFDRFKWLTVASGFAPACVLGLLLARSKREVEFNYDAIRSLLIEYIGVEKTTLRRDHTLENELAVLDMMLAQAHEVDAQAQRSLRTSKAPTRAPTPSTKKRPERAAQLSAQSQNGHSPNQLPPAPISTTYPPSTPGTLSPTTTRHPSPPSPDKNSADPHGEATPLPQTHIPSAPSMPPHTPSPPQPQLHPHDRQLPLAPMEPLPLPYYGSDDHLNANGGGGSGDGDYFVAYPQPSASGYSPRLISSALNHAGSAGAIATLAPAPEYDERLCAAFPSPMDPSADSFPDSSDTKAWAAFLDALLVAGDEE